MLRPALAPESQMTRTARIAVLAALWSALHFDPSTRLEAGSLRAGAQTPAPQATFRGGTDLVQVDVSVLDGKRHPVRGLTAADFTIFEDDQPRDVQAFTEVDLPDRVAPQDAAWTRDVPADVASNRTTQD